MISSMIKWKDLIFFLDIWELVLIAASMTLTFLLDISSLKLNSKPDMVNCLNAISLRHANFSCLHEIRHWYKWFITSNISNTSVDFFMRPLLHNEWIPVKKSLMRRHILVSVSCSCSVVLLFFLQNSIIAEDSLYIIYLQNEKKTEEKHRRITMLFIITDFNWQWTMNIAILQSSD